MTLRPFFLDVEAGQIQHLAQTVVMGKYSLGFGDLTELAVQPFNGIGRVYNAA